MAIEQTEEELNLKRKARRRLIGAVALTLAVVVILPMVLDSEPKPNGNDIELRIPAPDQAGEFVHGAAADSRDAVSGVAAASSVAITVAAPAAVVARPVAPHAIASPVKEHATSKPEPVVKKPAEPVAKTKPAALEGYVAQVGAYANADAARHELDRLKKWGFAAYTEKAGDKIRVRVGPFGDRNKAEQARHQLEKHGLQAVVLNAK